MNHQRRYIPTVAIIFDESGRVLQSRRDDPRSKYHGLWQFPGGGIEHGEHPRETAIRETREEVGLTIELLTEHPLVFNYFDNKTNVHTIVLAYPAKYVSGEIDTSKDPHTSEAKWFTREEFDANNSIPLAKEVLDEILLLVKSKQK